ncbi:NAD(P)/FAD-dependent oxidoreductase [Pirellulaceae bacterium]|nr:NAD(P)/FAD-dependent oxidoreductase [Pirellulaceae bacterium]MDB4650591.1 NAD(P)/FAD-dependent oxidoreductase [Pirellulaceae bacterium]
MDFDVIIIGAGAAGLFAATSAGERGKSVLLLEKNSKTGVKILMSGGTRCNITQNTEARGIVSAFGRNGKFLHSALAQLSPADVVQWIENEGVETKVESTGKVFPESDRAIDVRNAILRRVERCASVDLLTQVSVTSIEKIDCGFCVTAGSKKWTATKVIVTTGGKSYPGCGTIGEGYDWAKNFGHTIVDTVPALTPIVTTEQWVKDLKGITVEDCRLGVFDRNDVSRLSEKNFEKLSFASRRSSLLFTHFGLSGPAALDVSKQIAYRVTDKPVVVVDFFPDTTLGMLQSKLSDPATQRRQVGNLFVGDLPSRLLDSLVNVEKIDPKKRVAEASQFEIRRLISRVKRCVVMIEGTRGYKKAEVTAGGVHLKEVDSRTMESKFCEGLFFAGEVLDLDGLIGGYNFQSAFCTGYVAGNNV